MNKKDYLKGARKRIYDLMKDRRWHTRDEIVDAAFDPETHTYQYEALRRLRELRKFFNVQCRSTQYPGVFEYRLATKS